MSDPTPDKAAADLPADVQTQLDAAVFRRLLDHLDERTDVQNIELMNLAGFCRNCLSKWYRAAAEDSGLELDYEAARERVYGMPYDDWKRAHQSGATPEQMAQFAKDRQDREPEGGARG